MNCESLENLWHAWLDDPSGPSPALDPEAEAHRAVCASCRKRSAGFLALSTALSHLPSVPEPSSGFADRVLLNCQAERQTQERWRTWRRWGTLAAAAVLVISTGVGLWAGQSPDPERPPHVAAQPLTHQTVRLSDALAEATSATIELALESSAPAARLGLDVLDSTAGVHAPSADLADPIEASEAIQGAGRRLTSGVPPLSRQARRAFGFLLGPASTQRDSMPSDRDGA